MWRDQALFALRIRAFSLYPLTMIGRSKTLINLDPVVKLRHKEVLPTRWLPRFYVNYDHNFGRGAVIFYVLNK